jgi:hypothetical protein
MAKSNRAPHPRQLSEAEATAMAIAALETARRSLHPARFQFGTLPHRRQPYLPARLARALLDLPEVCIVGAALVISAVGALYERLGV